jgi:hypothetical protein
MLTLYLQHLLIPHTHKHAHIYTHMHKQLMLIDNQVNMLTHTPVLTHCRPALELSCAWPQGLWGSRSTFGRSGQRAEGVVGGRECGCCRCVQVCVCIVGLMHMGCLYWKGTYLLQTLSLSLLISLSLSLSLDISITSIHLHTHTRTHTHTCPRCRYPGLSSFWQPQRLAAVASLQQHCLCRTWVCVWVCGCGCG